jgi:hypothetical protein
MNSKETTIAKMTISLIVSALVSPAAFAGPTPADMFSVQTKTNSHTTPGPVTVINWFDSYDQYVTHLKPTAEDKAILARPFNQDAERVNQWRKVASKVAKNYRLLAANLRKMDLPHSAPEVKTYRDLKADWYQDAAAVYEDLLRPRQPATTIEELQEQLKQVSDKSDGLKESADQLNSMDLSLRQQYQVPAAKDGDEFQKFISGN